MTASERASVAYLLGVDGGTTKTIALVGRPDGTVVGAARGGGSNICHPNPETAILNLERAVSEALDSAGLEAADLALGVFSMSGADWPEDFDFIRSEMEDRGFGQKSVVVNDAVGGLRAGSPDGEGVTVICGTGTAIAARGPEGHIWHTSWWQEPDGAKQLGYKTLRAVYRAELGIDPSTTLTERVLEFLNQRSVEDVLYAFTARLVRPPRNVTALARLLLDEGQKGDATARRIIEDHGSSLGDYVLAAARRVGIEASPFALVLAGGVFRHPSPLLADSLLGRVRTTSPMVHAVNSRFEPAVGALLLALDSVGAPVGEPLLANLCRTMPHPSLFESRAGHERGQ